MTRAEARFRPFWFTQEALKKRLISLAIAKWAITQLSGLNQYE